MRDVHGSPAPGGSRFSGAVPVGRLPVGRVRLVTALFTDLDAAVQAAVAAEDRGYQRDRITVVLSPTDPGGRDLEIRRRRDRDPPGRGFAGGRDPVGADRLDDLLDGAHLIVAAEAATDAEGHELAELLTASGGRVVRGGDGSGARSPPSLSGSADPTRGGPLPDGT